MKFFTNLFNTVIKFLNILPKGAITVTIPIWGEFCHIKYIDNENCYLAEALTKAGYQNVKVSSYGETKIDGVSYHPYKEFDSGVLKKAFQTGKNLKVTLIPNK